MKRFVFKPSRRKNGATVYSRCYSGRYRLEGDAEDTTVALHVTEKQVAEEKLRLLVREKEQERAGLILPKALREGMQAPLASLLENHLSELTRLGRDSQYLKGLRANLERLFRECRWNFMRDVTAESFRAWRKAQRKTAKTLNEYLKAASGLFRWLERDERIPRNPLQSITLLARSGAPTFERRALTDEECRRLISCAGERSLCYRLALETGFRRGELAKLEWRDIGSAGGTHFIRARSETTKNGKTAMQPITEAMAETLRQAKPRGADARSRVFPDRLPSVDQLKLDCAAAGIEFIDAAGRRFDFHALRKTFCTRLVRSGAAMATCMKLMRHADPKLTMQVYTDAAHLPTAETINGLPSLVPVSSDAPGCALAEVVAGQAAAAPVRESPSGTLAQDVEAVHFRQSKSFSASGSLEFAGASLVGPEACCAGADNEGVTEGDAPGCAPFSSLPADLREVIDGWPGLSPPLQAAVLAIVRSTNAGKEVRP